ncbi:ARM repeat-containing protein [Atractiella rhizophila]|nr:ARM repeat-containing protein [Atractiella rhizophila]
MDVDEIAFESYSKSGQVDDIAWSEDASGGGDAIKALQDALEHIWLVEGDEGRNSSDRFLRVKIVIGSSSERLEVLRALRDATVGSKELKSELLRRSTLMDSLLKYINLRSPSFDDDTESTLHQTRLLTSGIFLSLANMENAQLLLWKPYHSHFLDAFRRFQGDKYIFSTHSHVDDRKEAEALLRTIRLLYGSIQSLGDGDLWGMGLLRTIILPLSMATLPFESTNTNDAEKRALQPGDRHALLEGYNRAMSALLQPEICEMLRAIFERCCEDKWTSARESQLSQLLNLTEPACDIISTCFRTAQQQNHLLDKGSLMPFKILDGLLQLADSNNAKLTDKALAAIATLIRDNQDAKWYIVHLKGPSGRSCLEILVDLSRHRAVTTRLTANLCRIHIIKSLPQLYSDEDARNILAVFQTLFDDTHNSWEFGETAASLALFLQGSHNLQTIAFELNLAEPLMQFLLQDEAVEDVEISEALRDPIREASILALSSMMLTSDTIRSSFVKAGIMPILISSVRSRKAGLIAAALQAIRILSRSTTILRTTLEDELPIECIMDQIVDGRDDAVKATALAALCNLVTAYAPMKKHFIERNGLQLLDRGLLSTCCEVRRYAMHAYSNAAAFCPFQIKQHIVATITWDRIEILCQDPDDYVCSFALNLLRNLASGKENHITFTVQGLGLKRMLDLIARYIVPAEGERGRCQNEALWVLSNISQTYYQPIIEYPGMVAGVLHYFDRGRENTRNAAVWCLHNLSKIQGRVQMPALVIFEELRVRSTLEKYGEDPDVDIRERIKDILQIMDWTER